MKEAQNITELPAVEYIKSRHIHVRFECPQCKTARRLCYQYKEGKPKIHFVICEFCENRYVLLLTREFIEQSESFRQKFLRW
jgi:transcription elongation factor Elf1